MSDVRPERDWIGPVLIKGPVSTAVIEAMRLQNPELKLIDRGSYTRVLCPIRCAFIRQNVESILGRRFTLPGDLEAIMPSFKGNLALTSDAAEWMEMPDRPIST